MSYEFRKNMKKGNYVSTEKKETVAEVGKLPFADYPERGIRKETYEKFGVRMALSTTDRSIQAIYFPFYNEDNKLTGYKKRDLTLDKYDTGHFTVVGKVGVTSKLFGQQIAEGIARPKKKLVVAEGEFDCLSVWQASLDSVADTKYEGMEPFVVSLSCGTGNARAAVSTNVSFVESFDRVTIAFDNDSATPEEAAKKIKKGKEALEDVGVLITKSEVYVADFGEYHDPNDMLKAGKWKELSNAVSFATKKFSADKVVTASSLSFESLIVPREAGVNIPQFPELMAMTGGPRKRELWVVTGPSGFGKCHGEGQEILMHDLSTKKVEEICIGDFVMGADGSPRTVKALHSGVDMLYKVTPNKGQSYTVNSEHILYTESNADVVSRGMVKDQPFLVSAKDFTGLPKHYKEHVLSGKYADMVKLGGEGAADKDAYIFGLWLAEGETNGTGITLNRHDKELHEELEKYADENSYNLVVSPSNDRENSVTYRISGGFIHKLRANGMEGCKHIPNKFLLGNQQTRFDMLAGILDGDGYYTKGVYELIMKKNQLALDIVKLARTLGLTVTVKDKFSKCPGFAGEMYSRIIISGLTDRIPNRLPRKKALRSPNKNPLRTGLKVEEIGMGRYYGFEVDGDHLYCLPDGQITHNSTLCSTLAGEIRLAGYKVGMIFLEEELRETVLRMIAHKEKVNYNKLKFDPLSCIPEEKLKEAYEWVKKDDGFVFLDHFGSMLIEQLMSKIKYLMNVYDVEFILLDHLSMLVSGIATTDERKMLDMVMTELAAFCASHDVGIIAVSHLNRGVAEEFKPPKGQENEPFFINVRKESLRGSASLEQLSWVIIGVEPEIMPDKSRGRVRLTVLKNRPWGHLGWADVLKMNEQTGVLETANSSF